MIWYFRLERNLSEGSAWEQEGMISLERKEPDLTIAGGSPSAPAAASTALLASPTANSTEQLDADELELRKQRRIVIYVQTCAATASGFERSRSDLGR